MPDYKEEDSVKEEGKDPDFSETELSLDEKAVLEEARYRLILLEYSKDEPFLEAHILGTINELFKEKCT